MTTRRLCLLLALLALTLAAAPAAGQPKEPAKKKPAEVYTDPKQAGPDYAVQGEYAGKIDGRGACGVQVVALGQGAFDVWFLAGGLPGAGWDQQTRFKVGAVREGDAVELRAKTAGNTKPEDRAGFTGTLAGGKLTGATDKGEAFTFARVERRSPTLGARPPEGALVLFDGSDVSHWSGGKLVEGDLLFCGTRSAKPHAVKKLHVEFRTPFQPQARGQGRGNSGVYLHGREIQVLDSFGLSGEKNECGAFYGKARPLVNACLPPLTWQTYDVETTKDADGKLLATVWHNGVKVHDNFPLADQARPATIVLQNHGNPVVYRNIWVAPLKTK